MQSGYDDGVGSVYPIYHVVRRAVQMAQGKRVSVEGLPEGLVSYGAEKDGVQAVMIANVTDKPLAFVLDQECEARVLDTYTFDAAAGDANWLDNAPCIVGHEVELGLFAVAFIKFGQQ